MQIFLNFSLQKYFGILVILFAAVVNAEVGYSYSGPLHSSGGSSFSSGASSGGGGSFGGSHGGFAIELSVSLLINSKYNFSVIFNAVNL